MKKFFHHFSFLSLQCRMSKSFYGKCENVARSKSRRGCVSQGSMNADFDERVMRFQISIQLFCLSYPSDLRSPGLDVPRGCDDKNPLKFFDILVEIKFFQFHHISTADSCGDWGSFCTCCKQISDNLITTWVEYSNFSAFSLCKLRGLATSLKWNVLYRHQMTTRTATRFGG